MNDLDRIQAKLDRVIESAEAQADAIRALLRVVERLAEDNERSTTNKVSR